MCPNMWCPFENMPCGLEKNGSCVVEGCNSLSISRQLLWLCASLKGALFPCQGFCFQDLAKDVRGVSKSPAMIVLLSICPLKSSRRFPIYFGASMLSKVISSWWIDS